MDFETSYSQLTVDGDNAYPECECCGECCRVTVLALAADEVEAMHRYVREHGIIAKDQDGACCPFKRSDNRCGIWEARPQPCRLHNCRVPRFEVLRQNPQIVVRENLALVDLHEEFVAGNTGQWIVPQE